MLRIPMIMFCSIGTIATSLTLVALWPSSSSHGVEIVARPATPDSLPIITPNDDLPLIAESSTAISTPSFSSRAARPYRRDILKRSKRPYLSKMVAPVISAEALPIAPSATSNPAPPPLPMEKIQPAPAAARKLFEAPSIAASRSSENISSSDREAAEPEGEKQVSRGEEARNALRDIRPR